MKRPKTPSPGDLIENVTARMVILVITLIIIAIAALTYWPWPEASP